MSHACSVPCPGFISAAAVEAVAVADVAAARVARSWVGLRHFQRHDGQDLGAVGGVDQNLTQARRLGKGLPSASVCLALRASACAAFSLAASVGPVVMAPGKSGKCARKSGSAFLWTTAT